MMEHEKKLVEAACLALDEWGDYMSPNTGVFQRLNRAVLLYRETERELTRTRTATKAQLKKRDAVRRCFFNLSYDIERGWTATCEACGQEFAMKHNRRPNGEFLFSTVGVQAFFEDVDEHLEKHA